MCLNKYQFIADMSVVEGKQNWSSIYRKNTKYPFLLCVKEVYKWIACLPKTSFKVQMPCNEEGERKTGLTFKLL